ncbi:hypothetical protein BC937DRAFT_91551 [Endogone sp. FLAS-F59071]|nr:hypothetical protein BC937DRAFT_91551 [Endogone sp. FLAS-F59071]|eukprot:RUS16163.1 hypothetical protein BC937DRAFT_91551 [Endogone sp. FLAS-F59071]
MTKHCGIIYLCPKAKTNPIWFHLRNHPQETIFSEIEPNRQATMWYPLPGRFIQISVGSKDLIYGVTTNHVLVKWDPILKNWANVPIEPYESEDRALGTISASVGGDGHLSRIDERQRLFRFNKVSYKWEKTNWLLKRIYCGSADRSFGFDNFGNWHYIYDGMKNGVKFRGEFLNFPYVAAGVDGVSVILDPKDRLVWLFEPHLIQHEFSGAGKKQKLSTEGNINFQSVDIGSINSIVAVGVDTKIYKWEDAKWVPLEGSNFSYASVGYDGTIVALDNSGQALSNSFELNPGMPLPSTGSYGPDTVASLNSYQATPYQGYPSQSQPPLPSGWIAQLDPTGRHYYVETATGRTQWEFPQSAVSPTNYSGEAASYGQPMISEYPGQYMSQVQSGGAPGYTQHPPQYLSQYPPQSPQYPPQSPQYPPQSPQYPPQSPQYSPQSPQYPSQSPQYPPQSSPQYPPPQYPPPQYPPQSPQYPPQSPHYPPQSPHYPPQQPAVGYGYPSHQAYQQYPTTAQPTTTAQQQPKPPGLGGGTGLATLGKFLAGELGELASAFHR